jgi:hypothetical protein
MKKISILTLLVALVVVMAGPAQAAFTVGGENGWQLSTDGIVNIFGAYQSTSPVPDTAHFSFLGNAANPTEWDQKFGVRVGLLPSIIALNVKAPTVNGIESNVRVGFYPNVQNGSERRFDTSPNIDNREFFYTAKGKFGEFLAGRALNLFQGQNILNDMTLFTAGVVDMSNSHGGTSLGHIGYGYLYTNFGPQFRYTTPDFGGFKVAFEIGEPYRIDSAAHTKKTDTPRFETELSYATTFKGGSVHAWLEGLLQNATRYPNAYGKESNTSVGIAPGFNVAFGPVGVMASGYYGKGLGMISAQDGGTWGPDGVDQFGNDRTNWGFLVQTTYQVTDSIRLALNYGDNRSNRTDQEASTGTYFGDASQGGGVAVKKSQEALVAQINYNLNKFTQFTLEYIWAQDVWQDNQKQRSNQVALGTVFFW